MKRNLVSVAMAGFLLLLFQSSDPGTSSTAQIPDEVSKILKTSCYDCHSTDARNKDAREALNFEKWNDYRLTKKIGLLGDICKLVGEKKMPPEKYLANKPESNPTDEQRSLICDWTEEESNKLMGNN